MSAKKINKSAFVRNLPADMPAKDVIARAKAAGFTMSPAHVYAIRSKDNSTAGVAKRRPGRPAGTTTAHAPVRTSVAHVARGGLEAEIERIVERKVSELLRAKLGTLLP